MLEQTLAVLTPHLPPGTSILRKFQPLPLLGCHPGMLSQALFAVFQNALLSREEGLVLQVSTACVDGDIAIGIADNGCGIAVHVLPRIFEPFFTTREVGRGTGMGLTVAREIVTAAGGRIEVDSRECSGTNVTIHLPFSKNNGN
jgi:signal transduction histidine kinase